MSEEIKVDAEFRDLLDPLTPEERASLTASLIAEGRARDRLIVWQETRILIDGHHRYEICAEHGLPYDVEEMSFASRPEALRWALANQAGRRNATPQRLAYIRGKLFNESKRAGAGRPKKSPQSEGNTPAGETAERIAGKKGVSRATVERDGQYAAALDSLPPVVKAAILAKDVKASRSEVIELAGAGKDAHDAAAVAIASGARTLPAIVKAAPAPSVNGQAEGGFDMAAFAEPFKADVRALSAMIKRYEKFAAHPKYGAFVADVLARIKHDGGLMAEAISVVTPVCLCEKCGGKGCKTCRNTGFWTRGLAQSRKK